MRSVKPRLPAYLLGPLKGDGRRTLLDELDRYAPVDARERAMADRVREFVARHEACFERSLAIGHLTGSAWIVSQARDAAVLVHHRKLDKWLQPGGHADGDPDVRAVARREAVEETGLVLAPASRGIFDLDVHAIPERPGEPGHEHFDIRFAFVADRANRPVVNGESNDVRWVTFDEIERYAIDDSVRRLVAKSRSLVL